MNESQLKSLMTAIIVASILPKREKIGEQPNYQTIHDEYVRPAHIVAEMIWNQFKLNFPPVSPIKENHYVNQ